MHEATKRNDSPKLKTRKGGYDKQNKKKKKEEEKKKKKEEKKKEKGLRRKPERTV